MDSTVTGGKGAGKEAEATAKVATDGEKPQQDVQPQQKPQEKWDDTASIEQSQEQTTTAGAGDGEDVTKETTTAATGTNTTTHAVNEDPVGDRAKAEPSATPTGAYVKETSLDLELGDKRPGSTSSTEQSASSVGVDAGGTRQSTASNPNNLGDLADFDFREQDRLLPIANIGRIMRKALPDNAKISKEAKECIQECLSEFISFVVSEASDKCMDEKRRTIGGEDVVWSLNELGFDNYQQAMQMYLAKIRETERKK